MLMKIIYFANFKEKQSDRTEQHIKKALEELGHEVIPIQEEEYEKISQVKNADLFLFHKAGVGRILTEQQFVKLLCYISCPKVCWYFDKILPEREEFIAVTVNYADYVFVTDDTYRRRHRFKNMFCLRQGIGEKHSTVQLMDYECDVAFVGGVYSQERMDFVTELAKYYGDKFKVFNNDFNQDLASLCSTAKVIVAPPFLANDFYWSSRIYMILGSGGFLIHPELYGLKEEFEEGKHYVGYKRLEELMPTIDYFLRRPEAREAIKKQGFRQCWSVATYKHRVKSMLKTINGNKTSTGAIKHPKQTNKTKKKGRGTNESITNG